MQTNIYMKTLDTYEEFPNVTNLVLDKKKKKKSSEYFNQIKKFFMYLIPLVLPHSHFKIAAF